MVSEMLARLTFIRAVVIGLLLAGIYYVIFYDSGSYQTAMIAQSQQEMIALKADLAKVQADLERSRSFEAASKDLGSSIQKMLDFIPENFGLGQLMKTVSEEARVSGLDLSSMQPAAMAMNSNQEKNLPEFEEIGVNIQIRGQFSQILSFMSSLTEKKQIFLFENIEIFSDNLMSGASSEQVGKGEVSMRALIRAYSYLGRKVATAPVQPGGQ
ncbi:MAG TPA: hypothetical protein DCL41_08705 [Bdellovibrionales bacterium]|nr:hypothetical protein [Pseudobdellovibrionaceae bacterium]HAG91938.1 hypothetical protein [Bdellovibrionales bacterium]|tara:strand:- start:1969 stop:2607 length:639 start_codon:yes stop_codon:yes gene_type:complete